MFWRWHACLYVWRCTSKYGGQRSAFSVILRTHYEKCLWAAWAKGQRCGPKPSVSVAALLKAQSLAAGGRVEVLRGQGQTDGLLFSSGKPWTGDPGREVSAAKCGIQMQQACSFFLSSHFPFSSLKRSKASPGLSQPLKLLPSLTLAEWQWAG